jgi:hypothetical protein
MVKPPLLGLIKARVVGQCDALSLSIPNRMRITYPIVSSAASR